MPSRSNQIKSEKVFLWTQLKILFTAQGLAYDGLF